MSNNQRKVLFWNGFFNNKESIFNSPYFMLNHALKLKKINYLKKFDNFMDSYLDNEALCGRNKETFHNLSPHFTFWHYHCGDKDNEYNESIMTHYYNKKCMFNYEIIQDKKCLPCTLLAENHNGRTSAEVIYYVKFKNSDVIGIVGYGEKHVPYLKLEDPIIQTILSLNIQNFIEL